MSNHQFEKQIKNKMDNHSIEPSEDLLDRIFEKRAAQSKPAVGFFNKKGLYFAAAATLISTIVLFNVLSDSGKSADNQNVQISQNNQNLNNGQGQSSNSKSQSPHSFPDNKSNSLNTSELENVNAVEKVNSSSLVHIPNEAKTRGRKSSAPKTNSAKSSGNYSINNNVATIAETKPVKTQAGSIQFLNVDPNAYFNVDAANRPSIDREKHIDKSHMFVYHSVSPDVLENNDLTYSNTVKISKFPVAIDLDEAKQIETQKVESAKMFKKPLFIDLTVGQIFNQFNAKSDLQELKGVSNLSNMSMSNRYDLRVSYPVAPRINVFSGLGFAQISTHYQGDLKYQMTETEQRTYVKYINDPILGPKQVITHDTVDVLKDKSQNVDFKNKYSVISLPLGASYNFGYKRFDFGLQGSMNINFVKTNSVQVWNRESQGFVVSNNNSSFVNIGFGTSVLAAYKISPKFRLLFEPGIRYYRIGGQKTGNNLNENLFNSSLSIGLRYTLF